MACPNAKENQAYFKKKGSSVSLTRSIDPTDKYTVEFWFKIPKDSTLSEKNEDGTYLFTLSESSAETEKMTIFIDKEGLKCAPFGMGSKKNVILRYSGIKPFNTDKW